MSIEEEIKQIELDAAFTGLKDFTVEPYRKQILHTLGCKNCSESINKYVNLALSQDSSKLSNEQREALNHASNFLTLFNSHKNELDSGKPALSDLEILILGITAERIKDAILESEVRERLSRMFKPESEN